MRERKYSTIKMGTWNIKSQTGKSEKLMIEFI